MPALTGTATVRSRFLGKLKTQIATLFDQIFATISMDYTAGQRRLAASTSATNPTLGASAGFLFFTSAIGGLYRLVAAASATVADADHSITVNNAGTCTLTLPAAASYPNRVLELRTITANAVVSASSNVVPRAGGAAGTAILAATAGSWARLHSDGTNWHIIAGS